MKHDVVTPPAPKLPEVGGPLDEVNTAFHDAYDEATGESLEAGPIFVVLADSLVVYDHGERCEHPFTPRLFHVIKSIAHAPLGIYAALHRFVGQRLQAPVLAGMRGLKTKLEASLLALPSDIPEEAIRDDVSPLLRGSLAVVESVLGTGSIALSELDGFAREMGTPLARSTEHATRIQVASLDACVAKAVASLGESDRELLQVVVTGNHQAREQSLGMQYFRARLGEKEGDDERVTYAEGVDDADAAFDLVGKRRLDRAIAKAFFGDAKRLERDVLGAAFQSAIRSVGFPPRV